MFISIKFFFQLTYSPRDYYTNHNQITKFIILIYKYHTSTPFYIMNLLITGKERGCMNHEEDESKLFNKKNAQALFKESFHGFTCYWVWDHFFSLMLVLPVSATTFMCVLRWILTLPGHRAILMVPLGIDSPNATKEFSRVFSLWAYDA